MSLTLSEMEDWANALNMPTNKKIRVKDFFMEMGCYEFVFGFQSKRDGHIQTEYPSKIRNFY